MTGYVEQNIAYYNAHAKKWSDAYTAVPTETSLPFFAKAIARAAVQEGLALDLGCEAGNNARWLAERGWRVTAVDGSEKFLEEARASFSHPSIDYLLDAAPALPSLWQKKGRYRLALIKAFIFHFDAEARQEILDSLALRLEENAFVHLTLRHGPIPEGRVMFAVEPEEISDFGARHGLQYVHHGLEPDHLLGGREGVSWDHVSLWRGDAWKHVATL